MQVSKCWCVFMFLPDLFCAISIDYISDYIQAVSNWMAILLTKIRPWIYINGGNIITVQVIPIIISYLFLIVKFLTILIGDLLKLKVENEYGSYFACDYNYMRHLRALSRFFLGEQTVLFTTDGNTDKEMTCGTLEGLYATVDFGTSTA